MMSFRTSFPFKRLSKNRPADKSAELKTSIFFLFTGFSSYILFFETLMILLNLDMPFTQLILVVQVLGIPELDVLTPLIIIAITPYLYLYSNIFLFGLSLIPWFFSGFITGMIFGPKYDRTIILSPPIFIGGIILVFILFLVSILGIGTIYPSLDFLFLGIILALIAFYLAMYLFAFTMPLIIPAFVGYSLGRKYTIRAVVPRVFLAQPDRLDPNKTRCKFLTTRDTCGIGTGRREIRLIPNICDNKWNHATCRLYQDFTKKSKTISFEGDYINEIH